VTRVNADEIEALVDEAAKVDGRRALSEQSLLNLRSAREGTRHLTRYDDAGTLVGYAQVDGSNTAELVVAPAARGQRHGRALAEETLKATGGDLRAWAHGGHPAARHLAEVFGLELFRELRQMRRPISPETVPEVPALPEAVTLRTFVPGQDDAAWLAVNAAAFAHHPEQGSWTERDLRERFAEPWFDPAGFFLAERDGRLVGFHWTKVHREPGRQPMGEVYVVGVAPGEQGGGLGQALTAVGLRHLAVDRGLRTVLLYVDADNTAAVRVYERLGFLVHEVDLMFRTVS
jgi:mycothiol synthase